MNWLLLADTGYEIDDHVPEVAAAKVVYNNDIFPKLGSHQQVMLVP